MEVLLNETTVELPTYRVLAPSANPALFDKNFHPFPYTMQNHLDGKPTPVLWQAVELENEYLKLTVLPEMGGHIASLYDKLAGREIFTPIRAVKPRMIAHRGAWAAGGVEFNFPISHSPTTMDHVNHTTRRYPDGSASVVFGAIERLTFMSWKVELRLYPGKAYLEQSVELLNTTDNFNRFYFWTNAAVPYVRGMRMTYPFDWRTTLDRGYEKWPMDGALDSSDPAMIPDGYETFGKLMMRDFFGVHYPGWDFGVGHAASRKRVKGAKFFHWGNSEQAGAWNRALLPGGQEYIEIQSGPFESQTVFRHLMPGGALRWKEYWFGVRGIGMQSHATRDAAVSVERAPDGIVVLKFSANGWYEDCAVRLTHGATQQQTIITLSPESPAAVEFTGVAPDDDLAIDVVCGGRLLLSLGRGEQREDEAPDADLYEDSRTWQDPDEYNDRPLMRGVRHEQWGRLSEAAEAYDEALCMNPDCTTALTRLGRIRLAQRRPADAADCFERALRYDNRCGTARFGLAAAKNALGEVDTARKLFLDIAADDPLFEASSLETAALNIRLDNSWDNIALLEDLPHPQARFLLSASCRTAGLKAEADEPDGLADEYLLAERFMLTGDGTALLTFTGGREDQLVCVALRYARLGLNSDCLRVLSLIDAPGMKTALVRAFCGDMPLSEALAMPLGSVFVNEPPLLDLLEFADDPTGVAAWLTGCFEYAAGLREEALEHWQAAYEMGLRHTALLFCLGQAHYREGDAGQALRYLREDAALHGSGNEESLALLFNMLREQGDVFQRLELLPLLQEAANRPMVLAEIVEALRDGDMPEEALELMENGQFQNREGRESAGLVWSGVVCQLAQKLAREGKLDEAREMADRVFEYPEGLYYGRSPNRSQAEHHHALGQLWRITGDYDRAREAFREGAAEGGVAAIRKNEAAMRWVRLCQDEMGRV